MEGKKAYAAVLLIQSVYAGMFILSKAAFTAGLNNFIFVFYRQAVAAVFLAPFAFFFEWKNAPPLSFRTFCKIFFISFCGITLSLDVYGVALIYTSATLAAATTNCLPVITFLLAVLLRLEEWKIKTRPGMAKLGGIVTCLGGAVTLTLYKGPLIPPLNSHPLFSSHHYASQQPQHSLHSSTSWVKGCFLMLTSNTFWALWLVLQARVLKCYPSKLLFTTLSCFLGAIQSFIIAIAFERNPSEWMLGWNVRLIAVAYCGVVVTGVAYYLQAYVIQKRGPVFLSTWTPFSFVLTVLCSTLLVGEFISFGSVLGGVMFIGGLYSFLWAKSKEKKMIAIELIKNTQPKECVLPPRRWACPRLSAPPRYCAPFSLNSLLRSLFLR